MLHLPLLSAAYEAALFGERSPDRGTGVEERPAAAPCPPDDEPALDEFPEDEDDLETARTRPLALRLDQIHL
jgi:hypothetical protein